MNYDKTKKNELNRGLVFQKGFTSQS